MRNLIKTVREKVFIFSVFFVCSLFVQISSMFFWSFFAQSIESGVFPANIQTIFAIMLPVLAFGVLVYLLFKDSKCKIKSFLINFSIFALIFIAVTVGYSYLSAVIQELIFRNTAGSLLKIKITTGIFISLGKVPLNAFLLCIFINIFRNKMIFKGLKIKKYLISLAAFLLIWGIAQFFRFIETGLLQMIIECILNTVIITSAACGLIYLNQTEE